MLLGIRREDSRDSFLPCHVQPAVSEDDRTPVRTFRRARQLPCLLASLHIQALQRTAIVRVREVQVPVDDYPAADPLWILLVPTGVPQTMHGRHVAAAA